MTSWIYFFFFYYYYLLFFYYYFFYFYYYYYFYFFFFFFFYFYYYYYYFYFYNLVVRLLTPTHPKKTIQLENSSSSWQRYLFKHKTHFWKMGFVENPKPINVHIL